jgi:hypothetical protein
MAIQRPYHAAKSTTCARAAQVLQVHHRNARLIADEPNPRIWLGDMEHEQGRGSVGVWHKPLISG